MNFKVRAFALVLMVLGSSLAALAQTTAFSYQGRLIDGSFPANGTYHMQFTLHSAVSGSGNQVGPTVTNTAVNVVNGVFTVEVDFGNEFPGADRWIEVSVKKPADPTYSTLTPRQKLLSVPYAVRSANVTTTSGNSIVQALNDPATTATINGVVRIKPTAEQGSTSAGDGTDAVVNLRGSYDSGGIRDATFRINHDGAILATGVADGASALGVPATGFGTRMVWHPRKSAFRAGGISTRPITDSNGNPFPNPGTQWDEENIGEYSIALGENVRASAQGAVALGYDTIANRASAFAVGEGNIASGISSVAMGYHANANFRQGAFVYGDRSNINPIFAGVDNSANWRVSGGFRIFTSSNLTTGVTIQSGASPSNWSQLNAVISTSTGALLTTGGVWTNASSRDLKRDFSAVDGRSVLRKLVGMPIQTWGYNSESADVRHIGPTSQDFRKAFGFGSDERAIGTVDADGVALAAIQGLNEELKDRDKKIEKLEQKLADQQQQLKLQQASMEALKKVLCSANPAAEVCK